MRWAKYTFYRDSVHFKGGKKRFQIQTNKIPSYTLASNAYAYRAYLRIGVLDNVDMISFVFIDKI